MFFEAPFPVVFVADMPSQEMRPAPRPGTWRGTGVRRAGSTFDHPLHAALAHGDEGERALGDHDLLGRPAGPHEAHPGLDVDGDRGAADAARSGNGSSRGRRRRRAGGSSSPRCPPSRRARRCGPSRTSRLQGPSAQAASRRRRRRSGWCRPVSFAVGDAVLPPILPIRGARTGARGSRSGTLSASVTPGPRAGGRSGSRAARRRGPAYWPGRTGSPATAGRPSARPVPHRG